MTTLTTGRATDFITFSRTSNATVTGADGRIRWAGHNLLTNSESFDASYWTKTNLITTGMANVGVAPDGTSTADKLIEDTSSNTIHQIQRASTAVAGVTYTLSCYVKAAGRTFVYLNDIQTSGVYFNLTTGSSGTTVGSPSNIFITNVGNGWWRIGFTCTAANANAGFDITIAEADNDRNYTGDGTSGLLIWGAHLYRSDLGGMVLNPARGDAYYPTTPRNLLGFTEDFSNAAWIKNSGNTVVSKAIIAPNGLRAADKIVASSSAGYQGLSQNRVLSAATHTISFYAKAAEYSLVWASDGANGFFYAGFNLATGATIAGAGGSKFVSSAIQPIGDGWYRCSIVVSNVAAGLFISIAGYPAGATLNPFGAQYTGDGTSGIYLWGAQLSDSASLDAYSPVYGAAVTSAAYYAPRLDFDPVTLAARGLLVEEQRTNFIVNSNSPIASTGTTITASAAISPDGTQSAYRIAKTDATTPRYISRNTGSMTTVGGRTYTVSTWFKYDGHNVTVSLEYNSTANWDLSWIALFSVTSTGVTTLSASSCTQSVQDVGNGWYRAIVTFTNGPSPSVTSNPTVLTRIDGGSGVSVLGYGGQIEELAAFPTSYIPTGASSATRTADVASVSTQAFPYSASEGTLVASATVYGIGVGTSSGIVSLTNGTAAENIAMFRTSSVNNIRFEIRDNNSTQAEYTVAMGTQPIKSAVAYALNNSNAALNGVAQTTDTTCTMPTVTAMQIGAIYTGGDFPTNGWIRQITYLPRRLSNSELAARTA